jgi:hypothetical protein
MDGSPGAVKGGHDSVARRFDQLSPVLHHNSLSSLIVLVKRATPSLIAHFDRAPR